jgi:hypothetical protein
MKNEWNLNRIRASYDESLDDYMLDACVPTETVVYLNVKPSQEAICDELSISRKIYRAHISKNDIYIVNKKTNEPIYCLKSSV